MRPIHLGVVVVALLARTTDVTPVTSAQNRPVAAPARTAAGPSTAAKHVGTLRGVARDAAGAILPGAVVLIQHWKLDNHGLSHPVAIMEPIRYADSQGRFSAQLPPDVYDVFVAYPTFAPYAKRVRIQPGKEVTVECELPFDALTRWVE